MQKRALLGSAATLAVGLLLTATAYACTIVGGQTYASPSSGSAGSGISVSASGARANTYYYVHFLNFRSDQDSMGTCMSRSGVGHPDLRYTPSILSSSSGSIATRTAPIPTDVHTSTSLNHPAHRSNSTNGGPALFCHITYGYGYATKSASVTVL